MVKILIVARLRPGKAEPHQCILRCDLLFLFSSFLSHCICRPGGFSHILGSLLGCRSRSSFPASCRQYNNGQQQCGQIFPTIILHPVHSQASLPVSSVCQLLWVFRKSRSVSFRGMMPLNSYNYSNNHLKMVDRMIAGCSFELQFRACYPPESPLPHKKRGLRLSRSPPYTIYIPICPAGRSEQKKCPGRLMRIDSHSETLCAFQAGCTQSTPSIG